MRILLIDDDSELCSLMADFFSEHGLALEAVHDGRTGLARALEPGFDLIILDVMLPVLNGFELLAQIRRRSSVPVIMLTARIEQQDRIAGLDAGADDYLVKPFALDELLARLRALLRRTSISGGAAMLRVGDLSLDPQRREAWRGTRELGLTKTEFDLLELLLVNANIVVTRDTIYERIWGYEFETSSKSLDVYIGYLRRKTEAGGETRLIRTIRGVGYTLRAA